LQVTQTNETDIGGAFTTAIINLKAAGGSLISVIGCWGKSSKLYSTLIVPEDSPIKGARDLIGKTVAVNTLAAAAEVYVRSYLAKEGLTPEEIEKVELIIVPPVAMEQALRSKQVDSAFMWGIYQDKILETGGVRIVFRDIDLFGDFTESMYCVRADFAKKNPKTTKKLVEATAKAIEWSKEQPIEEVRARMKEIVRKRNRDEDESLLDYFKSYGLASPGGSITDQDIQRWIDWLVSQGELKEGQIKPSDLYTNEFNPYVEKTISP
jgi:ABC-type nitrate/sulfonate/bicarbonate transport system substrate-binding protein